MRRRRCKARARLILAACAFGALAVSPRASRAQDGISREGALFLLVPVGARAVAMGQSVVASSIGIESIWWNPAGLARMDSAEVAIMHSQTIAANGDALNFVFPQGRAGVIAATAYLIDYGRQEDTDPFGNSIGSSEARQIVLAASYAATFGSRVNAGLTYKYLQDRLDCSGDCEFVATHQSSTSAIDFGVQVIVDPDKRLTLGLAVRNLGFRLQINDAEQADPLPTRIHLGAQYVVPMIERAVPNGELRISAEFVQSPALGNLSLRGGGEFAYKKQYFLRAGFVSGSGDGAGSAIGLGSQQGRVGLDISRAFGGPSSSAGTPPTYVSLRYRF
jgi:hypothetical protein